jgi:hypothetical protein
MLENIDAIFLDLGNTLRMLVKDEAYQAEARQRIANLVGASVSPEVLIDEVNKRYKVYRKWAFEQLTEAPSPNYGRAGCCPTTHPKRSCRWRPS